MLLSKHGYREAVGGEDRHLVVRVPSFRSDLEREIDGEMITESLLNKPQLVTNWTQFEDLYGGFVPGAMLAHSVYGFFNNGGSTCWVTRVADLTDDQKQELELDGGVLVQRVVEGAASRAGIGKGDVILSINNEPVKSAKQFGKLVEALPAGKSVAVLVQRGGNPTFLAIKVPDAN